MLVPYLLRKVSIDIFNILFESTLNKHQYGTKTAYPEVKEDNCDDNGCD